MSLISIIVPYYNRAKCLPNLIRAILAQTHQNWELIIVDDCSQDSVAAQTIIADFNDSRIMYHRHETNKNGAQARNTGIDLSHGEYVAFLDSDDIWQPNKLEMQLIKLQSSALPDNTLIYGALEKIFQGEDENAEILPKLAKRHNESVSDYLFASDGLMQTSTFFLTKTLANKIRFNPNLPRHQDYDFVLRAEHLGVSFIFIDIPLCQWITLPGDSNVATKGAGLQFAIKWFGEYQQYMTLSGAKAYLSRQMFYIAVKNKSILNYYAYIFNEMGYLGLLNVMSQNLKLILSKR